MSKIFEPTNTAVGIKLFQRPARDPTNPTAPVVLWNRQTTTLAYEPYVVRVHELAAHTASGPWILKFFFLSNDTGVDLGGGPYEVDLNNSNHAHCLAPSSIQLYDATNPAFNCGFLFLTREYITSAPVQANATTAGVVLPNEAVGDEKWPRSAGLTVIDLAHRLASLLEGVTHVDDADARALLDLFTVLHQLPLPIPELPKALKHRKPKRPSAKALKTTKSGAAK